jgi:hypothetical protein
MAHVTIDGRDFEMDTLSGEAKMQAANIMIIDQEIARLQTQIKIFTVAASLRDCSAAGVAEGVVAVSARALWAVEPEK